MKTVRLLLVLSAAGCASLSAEQCRTSSWYQLGERDGLYGVRPHIDQYAQSCHPFGVQPDEKAYLAGWVEGYNVFRLRSEGQASEF